MRKISTHVLDVSVGRPAVGVEVRLESFAGGAWSEVTKGETDADGRCSPLWSSDGLESGDFRLTFETGAYYSALGKPTLYPSVLILFEVVAGESYHIPLLLSPFGYSTYRGS
jgi:5-hydroxyisourate hydrolase